MKSKLIYPMALVLLAAACGGRSGARDTAQQQYETVQEGSAAGLTTTIHGPGETLPPITDTNVDTTTAIAMNPNAIPPAPQQASLGVNPAEQNYGETAVPPDARPAEPIASPASDTDTTATQPPTNTAPPPAAETPTNEEAPPPADDTSGEQAEEPRPPPPAR